MPQSICLPDRNIRFHSNGPHSVQSRHIQFPDRTVVFLRIACCHDDPALRNFVISKHFVLQKLKHGGSERFRDTINLVNEQDPFPITGAFLIFIDGTYNLTHGIFRHCVFHTVELLCHQLRQPHCTLSGMMCNRISYQTGPAFFRRLFHNRRLADSRRSDQKHRPLTHGRNPVAAILIFCSISTYGTYDLFFRISDIHVSVSNSISRVNVCAQEGALPF